MVLFLKKRITLIESGGNMKKITNYQFCDDEHDPIYFKDNSKCPLCLNRCSVFKGKQIKGSIFRNKSKWTKKKPKESGYYWIKTSDAVVHLCYVTIEYYQKVPVIWIRQVDQNAVFSINDLTFMNCKYQGPLKWED